MTLQKGYTVLLKVFFLGEHVYTVDGRNPANQLIYSLSMCIPVFFRVLYIVVQDFFHQQYVTLYMCLYVYCILVFFVNNKDNGWSTNTPRNKALLRAYCCNHWFPLIKPY